MGQPEMVWVNLDLERIYNQYIKVIYNFYLSSGFITKITITKKKR